MSIDAKVTLLNRVESAIGSILTMDDTNRVMVLLSDQIADFIIEQSESVSGKDECLDAFLSAKEVEGRSPKTIDRYKRALTIVMKSVGVPTRQVTVFHLRKYLSDEKARGVQDSTLDGIRQIISAYFNWLRKETLIDKNPAANLGAIKSQKKLRKAFSSTDIEKLKTACKSDRDKAIILFLAATGCRISEVCDLNRDDLDMINLRCKVLGKGDKERIVFFDPVTEMSLERYLKSRTDQNPALFLNKNYQRFQPGGIRLMLNELGAAAGVENVHPHRFRRTLATNLTSKGMPIQEVAAILGHEKIDTTMKYVCIDSTKTQYNYQHYL